jgi:hypothetical protein
MMLVKSHVGRTDTTGRKDAEINFPLRYVRITVNTRR